MFSGKKGRLMFIFEATLEYFISILVTGSFLATITKELGLSDSLTGILTSITSLGCLFQLLTLSIRRKRVKSLVIALSVTNQLLFTLLYVIPMVNIPGAVKTFLFTAAIFLAYLLFNLAMPNKMNWLMSHVDNHHRGSFTANKEIFSLITGIVFSYVMGNVIDHFKEQGNIRASFTVAAIVILVLSLLHTLTMVLVAEKETEEKRVISLRQNISEVVRNKVILKLTLVIILYNIANYSCVPFYGAYCINDLGFSLRMVSVITIFGSVSRILVSRFWGNYADKNSFASMIEKCFGFIALAFGCMIFTVPSNGLILYSLYVIIHGVAMGGVNSAMVNLIYDYVEVDKRANSLAITQAFAGLTGFVTTLLISPLVSQIQNHNNTLWGIKVYAQQAVSVFGLVVMLVTIVYVRTVVMKIKKNV